MSLGAGYQLRRMDWRAADARGERFPIRGVDVADRKYRAGHLAKPGSASYSARTGPGKHRARSGCATFSFELAFAWPSGVRSHEDSIRHRGIRFDCSTCGNRSHPPSMARLGTITSATRTFRPSHDAGNNRVLETTRRHLVGHRQARCLHITHRANPSTQAICETPDCQRRAPVAIRRPVRVSTTLSRQGAQIGNDKVALECNGAARRETDCSRLAIACHDHCAEVSRQNAASTDTRKVTTSRRTRFANQCAADMARRTADGDSDHPAWL